MVPSGLWERLSIHDSHRPFLPFSMEPLKRFFPLELIKSFRRLPLFPLGGAWGVNSRLAIDRDAYAGTCLSNVLRITLFSRLCITDP